MRDNEQTFRLLADREEGGTGNQRRSAFADAPRRGYSELAAWRYAEREHGGSEQHTARLIRFDARSSAGVARATHTTPPTHATCGVDTDTDGDDDNAELDGGEDGDAADDEQELQSEEILRAAGAPTRNGGSSAHERWCADSEPADGRS